MKSYTLLKDCFLGKKGSTVKLNDRQASNLLAGEFIGQTASNTKGAKK